MPLPFDPTELAMLVNNGYFGVSDDKLEEIAEIMYHNGISLTKAAWECDIDPSNLLEEDKATIQEYCDEMD